MRELWFYTFLSRFGILNYRAKIMVMAFLGTHIPLISLAIYFALQSAPDFQTLVATIGVTLVATLVGTGITLFVLNELLKPVTMTSKALRAYRQSRKPSSLPSGFTDEVGTLMADATSTITHLEHTLDVLEHIDAATGLPNRKRFTQFVTQNMARNKPFAVAVVRFANFARIAETLDRERADAAAQAIADRLTHRIENAAWLARSGDDSFAMIVKQRARDGGDWVEATARLTKLIEAISADIAVPGLDIRPELYCGLAAYPADAEDAETLHEHAQAAAGQGVAGTPVVLHSAEARAAALDRFKIEQELRRAMDQDEFVLHYQPVVDIGAGKTVGAEALIRWQHPDRGLMSPASFIPAAESSGLIDPIGLWVMRQACHQLRSWSDQGRGDLGVAVNLSARQFLDPDLKFHVLDALDSAGVDPARLEIELTETAAMADQDHTRKVFGELRDLGVSIAIDDFGTGFASMSYLRKLPFDKLKIDREFVTDVHKTRDSQAICGALVELANGLDLRVLAEGTESAAEVDYLAKRGCHLFQGYVFARPVAADLFMPTVEKLDLSGSAHRTRQTA